MALFQCVFFPGVPRTFIAVTPLLFLIDLDIIDLVPRLDVCGTKVIDEYKYTYLGSHYDCETIAD